MQQPDFSYESHHTGIVAGIDEAGRGAWVGHVVAAAVILNRQSTPSGIADSKLLKPAKRTELFEQIITHHVVGIGMCSPEEIDQYNILGATKLAMKRALEQLPIHPDIALIDGNQLPDLACKMQAIVDGDALSLSIAAASIIAKVTRDRMMHTLGEHYPQYGFERHMGYGTKQHQEALLRFGVTPYHRKTFAPIRALLAQQAA